MLLACRRRDIAGGEMCGRARGTTQRLVSSRTAPSPRSESVWRCLRCADPNAGFARLCCPNCRHEIFVTFLLPPPRSLLQLPSKTVANLRRPGGLQNLCPGPRPVPAARRFSLRGGWSSPCSPGDEIRRFSLPVWHGEWMSSPRLSIIPCLGRDTPILSVPFPLFSILPLLQRTGRTRRAI